MAEEEKTPTLGEVAFSAFVRADDSPEGALRMTWEKMASVHDSWAAAAAAVERAVVARLAARVGPLTMTAEREMWIREMAIPGWYTREPIAEIDALRAQVAALREEREAFRDCLPRPEPTADVLAVIRDLWTGHKHTPESAAAHVEAIVESRLAAERAAHERLREAAEELLVGDGWEYMPDSSPAVRALAARFRAALSPAPAQAENGHVFPTATDSACTRCGAWTAMEPCPARVEGEKQGKEGGT